jgi:MOB kinase activator 1
MSVHPPAALQSSPPQPLPPHCTLKQSTSCATINTYATLRSPEPAYYSPTSAAAQKLHGINSPGSPFSNARTRGQFKPQRTTKGNSSYQLRQFAEATLGSGSLKKAVKLPEGEDLNEWLAVNGEDKSHTLPTRFNTPQSSTSTTKSTSSTAASPNSAPLKPAPK